MNKKLENILCAICYIGIFLWTLICLIYTWMNPPTLDDLTVEERIRYERMIFP